MNTKLIMILSAVFLAATGMALTFFPQEITSYTDIGPNKYFQIILQITGALYFAFAMVNWMAKGSIIGGIYNKPIVIGNLAHFFISGAALVKWVLASGSQPFAVYVFTGIYCAFAILFGILFSRHPAQPN